MISVVIPSYNRRDCILNLLRDVYAQEGCDFEVIVVDDCSSDNTVEAVCREFPQVELLINENNGGPCVSRNRGIRRARGALIVGFDSDVSIPDVTLLAQVTRKFSDHPDATGLAFRLLKPDGKSEDIARWWHPLPIKHFAGKSFQTSYFSGTGYAFRREQMVAAGLFPEIFYMHYEEVELAFRILDGGGKIIHCPDIKVLHHVKESSRRSEIHIFFKPRNQILLALSCFPFWKGVGFVIPRAVYQFSTALKGGHLSAFKRAINDAFSKGREVLDSRKPLKSETFKNIARIRVGLDP